MPRQTRPVALGYLLDLGRQEKVEPPDIVGLLGIVGLSERGWMEPPAS